jgi:hypothetical protein
MKRFWLRSHDLISRHLRREQMIITKANDIVDRAPYTLLTCRVRIGRSFRGALMISLGKTREMDFESVKKYPLRWR